MNRDADGTAGAEGADAPPPGHDGATPAARSDQAPPGTHGPQSAHGEGTHGPQAAHGDGAHRPPGHAHAPRARTAPHHGHGRRPAGGAGRALVVTASNRAAAGVYADTGGPLIAERLAAWGFTVDGPRVVPDGDPVEAALREGVGAGYDVVLTTGGTGISPTDKTPEATRRVIEHEVPGIPEAIRAFGREKVATAALSRGLAGVAGRTLIVNLPGSTGGVRDGLTVLEGLLPHAVDQLRGGDHPGSGGGALH